MSPADRRASIIEATLPLLREKGMAVSTKEIAKAAGIAEGTIFRVFDNKEEIVHACLHEVLDNKALVVEVGQVDRELGLRDRLAVAVGIMQDHLKELFNLMVVLQSSGRPLQRPDHADAERRRKEASAELDAAFVDLIGADAAQLRIPAKDFLAYLRMLTLSSVHPMLEGTNASAEELVGILLEGALAKPSDPRGKK
jgi:AcrR family transcriptional regulator